MISPKEMHKPVMLAEVLEVFSLTDSGFLLDATLGDGGHSEALLSAHKDLKLVGCDRDAEALKRARHRLARLASRCFFINASFSCLSDELDSLGIEKISGVLFDLGVSSLQLDASERGFSYRIDGPLDMRMNQKQALTAEEIVNEWEESEIADIIYEYGQERNSRRIAKSIVEARPIRTTQELAAAIAKAASGYGRRGSYGKRGKMHPSRRTFQALRIRVNEELEHIVSALDFAVKRLMPESRGIVISYHSGEDRIVKNFLRQASSPDSGNALIQLLHRKVKKPSQSEIDGNPRARSAKFRSFEKLAAAE